MTTRNISNLRAALYEKRCTVEHLRDDLKVLRNQVEQREIDAAGGSKALGATEEDRKRRLTDLISDDEAYGKLRAFVRDAELDLAQIEAAYENLLDERRDAEWAVRARLAQAITDIAATPRAEIFRESRNGSTAAVDAVIQDRIDRSFRPLPAARAPAPPDEDDLPF